MDLLGQLGGGLGASLSSAERSDGLFTFSPGAQSDAQVVVGLGEVGLDLDRCTKLGDCLVELTQVSQGVGEGAVCVGVEGVDPDCLAEFGGGLLPLILR